jgi:hypothetical protein
VEEAKTATPEPDRDQNGAIANVAPLAMDIDEAPINPSAPDDVIMMALINPADSQATGQGEPPTSAPDDVIMTESPRPRMPLGHDVPPSFGSDPEGEVATSILTPVVAWGMVMDNQVRHSGARGDGEAKQNRHGLYPSKK